MLAQFVLDDTGQDLIEYALLSGFVGLAGLLFFSELGDKMGTAYNNWVSDVSATSEPCAPGGCW